MSEEPKPGAVSDTEDRKEINVVLAKIIEDVEAFENHFPVWRELMSGHVRGLREIADDFTNYPRRASRVNITMGARVLLSMTGIFTATFTVNTMLVVLQAWKGVDAGGVARHSDVSQTDKLNRVHHIIEQNEKDSREMSELLMKLHSAILFFKHEILRENASNHVTEIILKSWDAIPAVVSAVTKLMIVIFRAVSGGLSGLVGIYSGANYPHFSREYKTGIAKQIHEAANMMEDKIRACEEVYKCLEEVKRKIKSV